MGKWIHRLSEKNLENLTATCAECGPVEVYLTSKGNMVCRIDKYNQVRESNNKRNGKGARIGEGTKRFVYKSDNEKVVVLSQKERFEFWKKTSNGLCDLCDRILPYEQANYDHDHATGDFRGWLCRPCNIGLGMLGDTEEGLVKAITYLKNS